jgi:NADH-quinone oxidoreductase subunit J
MDAAFQILALMTLAGAAGAVWLRKPVHCALSAAVAFVGLAVLFLQLGAQFVAFAQMLVYVGAVAVLIVFTMLLTRTSESATTGRFSRTWIQGLAVAVLAGGALVFAILNSPPLPAAALPPEVTVKRLGESLMTRAVIPLQIVGVLLTAALLGAVVLLERPRK